MSVTVLQNNGGPLGSLGTLGIALGTVTGQPWLTALGTGIKATDNLLNPKSSVQSNKESAGTLQEALKGLWGWVNPASNDWCGTHDWGKRIAEKAKNLIWEV